MAKIRYILFDAANTLIHKPVLWEGIKSALNKHGISVDDKVLKYHHKIVSEVFIFPDRTSSEFYRSFNSELLFSIGIIPKDDLLDDIFSACTYLPWQPFEDTVVLKKMPVPLGILSNFNSSLSQKIHEFFGPLFSNILVSEELDCAKPDIIFYEKAIDIIGISPENILYVGDSIKLDMKPAVDAGLNAYLIDRVGAFPAYKNRLNSLEELCDFFV
jgi:putative hydrolase of the HAD superfamily